MEEKATQPEKYYKENVGQREHLAGNGYLCFENIIFVQSTAYCCENRNVPFDIHPSD